MNPGLFWPYDEISLSINESLTHAVVRAPWLEAQVNLNDSNRAKIILLANKFQTQALLPADIELINWFFAEFHAYPFCYILPTQKKSFAFDQPSLVDANLLPLSLDAFLQTTSVAILTDPTRSSLTAKSLNLSRTTWDWDVQAAMQFATLGNRIHPESLLSVARRFHLLDLMADKQADKVFTKIKALSPSEFKVAAAILVRQNHYVTQHCRAALLPALETAGSARELVERFIKEEHGHDRILGVALQNVTGVESFDAVPVSVQTRLLMHLLEFSARKNFLAFAMAIDMFERSTFEDMDPLASLLAEGGFAKAASQVNRHKEINDVGDHENVACSFLRYMAPCDPQYAFEALRIAEAISLLTSSILISAFDLFDKPRLNSL